MPDGQIKDAGTYRFRPKPKPKPKPLHEQTHFLEANGVTTTQAEPAASGGLSETASLNESFQNPIGGGYVAGRDEIVFVGRGGCVESITFSSSGDVSYAPGRGAECWKPDAPGYNGYEAARPEYYATQEEYRREAGGGKLSVDVYGTYNWVPNTELQLEAALFLGGFLPWVGEMIDGFDCANGSKVSCAMVPAPFASGRLVKAVPDLWRLLRRSKPAATATINYANFGGEFLDDSIRNLAPSRILDDAFQTPGTFVNRHGQLTNGSYTVDSVGNAAHQMGNLSSGKSQFLHHVNADRAVLDAAAYADEVGLWGQGVNVHANQAIVFVENGPVGVLGRSGELTNWIKITRTDTAFVHGWPASGP